MSYMLNTGRTSANRSSRAGHRIRHITIHYWGRWVGQSHDGIVEYLVRKRSNGTSAHYVVSPGRVDRIVPESDTAWANGNRTANQESITIELCPDPARLDATIATCADLVRDIRARHGDLPLVPHMRWTETDCPGPFTHRLGEIDRLARRSTARPATPPPFPLPSGMYYGPASGPIESVSGRGRNDRVPDDVVHGPTGWHSIGLQLAQQRLRDRGWTITADGRWGPETDSAVLRFKRRKRGWQDSRLGPETWALLWSEPVT